MLLPTQPTSDSPTKDGQVSLYESPELCEKSWFDHKARTIFVNGMDNSGDDHREAARALSTLLASPVLGVYNASAGKALDLFQCVTDKLTLGRSAKLFKRDSGESFAQLQKSFDAAFDAETAAAKSAKTIPLTRSEFAESLIELNAATKSLYWLLQQRLLAAAPIFAHSQGNLITSNALAATALARGESVIAGRRVSSFGSPCRFWPPGIVRENYLFTFDPVGYLDYGFDWSSSKVGFKVAHAFAEYRKSDPDFVINRFRTGGWGKTLNMDEEGLADALYEMGMNPGRIAAVFARLAEEYSNDADDVALLYVEKVRKLQPDLMKNLLTELPSLAESLVHCLTPDEIFAVNTRAEKEAAAWVTNQKPATAALKSAVVSAARR